MQLRPLRDIAAILLIASAVSAPAMAAGPEWQGFYAGIAAGMNHVEDADVDISTGAGSFGIDNAQTRPGVGASAAFGFNFGGPRLELEVGYRRNRSGSDLGRAPLTTATAMINAIYEFFSNAIVSPYLGVGVGGALIWSNGDRDGLATAQGIIGLNVKLTRSVLLTADYRYLRTIDDSKLKIGGNDAEFRYAAHGGFIGLTYRFGVRPPPLKAAMLQEMPAPPSAPLPVFNYVVYFAFDRAELTNEAVDTVRQAAGRARGGDLQRLQVSGHADRAGSERYNLALSLRRADAVRALLIAEGVDAGLIAVVGLGETQPARMTRDGVPEARNRRVKIVVQ